MAPRTHAPRASSTQVGGKRLYESARKGQEVERAARRVTVERFELRRDASDRQAVHFEVTCSKGTYIRSLAADLGAALGSAAHLTALRREAIGEHSVGAAWEVTSLADQLHAQRRAAQAAAEEQAAAAGEQAAAAADGAAP